MTNLDNITQLTDLKQDLLQIIKGLFILIGGGIAAVAWVSFCFGTIVVGVLLLMFAPGVLYAPFAFAGVGFVLILKGFDSISLRKQLDDNLVDRDSVWDKSSKNLESISELIEKSKETNKDN